MHFLPICLCERRQFDKKKIISAGNHAQITLKLSCRNKS